MQLMIVSIVLSTIVFTTAEQCCAPKEWTYHFRENVYDLDKQVHTRDSGIVYEDIENGRRVTKGMTGKGESWERWEKKDEFGVVIVWNYKNHLSHEHCYVSIGHYEMKEWCTAGEKMGDTKLGLKSNGLEVGFYHNKSLFEEKEVLVEYIPDEENACVPVVEHLGYSSKYSYYFMTSEIAEVELDISDEAAKTVFELPLICKGAKLNASATVIKNFKRGYWGH